MLIDCRELDDEQSLSCDICIVGAGAAGITVARLFLAGGHRVCLLESGRFNPHAKTQDLYRGWTEFNDESPSEGYLHGSRLRYFGGTTNHWAGLCRTLDPIDFRKRDWVEHSGWPIDESDLKPYYAKAAEIVDIEPFDDYDTEGRGCSGGQAVIDSDNICSKIFHISAPTRFGSKYRKELIKSENVSICVSANVLRISLNENGDAAEHVICETLTGIHFKVAAKYFILSTGGVENARILLLSNSIQNNGIGNSHDQVGRYFMEHPQYPRAANIVFTGTPEKLSKYDSSTNTKSFSVLGFTEQVQKTYRLLNSAMRIVTLPQGSDDLLDAGEVIRFFDTVRTGRSNSERPYLAQVVMFSELNPDPGNRVLLDEEVDRLGLQKARLKLVLTTQHIESIIRSIQLFATELARASNGRLRIDFREDDPARKGYYFPAHHHLGTTRMSETPKTGVVDSDCKIHGMSNLFVAGSSVFPTGGFANPTFTIVALALRLGEHIKSKIERGLI